MVLLSLESLNIQYFTFAINNSLNRNRIEITNRNLIQKSKKKIALIRDVGPLCFDCCCVFVLLPIGRQHYTPEEDAAILNYVNKYKKGLGGNLIWKKMEKEGVTSHSWQSMKYRYNTRLAKKNVNVATADNVSKLKEAENQVQNPSEDDRLFNVFGTLFFMQYVMKNGIMLSQTHNTSFFFSDSLLLLNSKVESMIRNYKN